MSGGHLKQKEVQELLDAVWGTVDGNGCSEDFARDANEVLAKHGLEIKFRGKNLEWEWYVNAEQQLQADSPAGTTA
jgi:hypothetical protein